MKKTDPQLPQITAFLPFTGAGHTATTVRLLRESGTVGPIILLTMPGTDGTVEGCTRVSVESLTGSATMHLMAKYAVTSHMMLVLRDTAFEPGAFALQRFLAVAEQTGAGLVYADYAEVKQNERRPHPVIDYHPGSIRDDFNFGPVVLLDTKAFVGAVGRTDPAAYRFAGWYDVRLGLARKHPIVHIPEPLVTAIETDTRRSGERQFDYVDPRNRAVQVEMEFVATDHLKAIGAWLKPVFRDATFDDQHFAVEASVIIPVRNRVATIGDAVGSVLKQQSSFPFNLIVVDNHSTDGTTDLLREAAERDSRVLHIIPDRTDLGIGGCWTHAIHHPHCGRFALQLDSDDLYKDETTVQRIVDTFRREKCAMVIGSYQMTNFNLEEIPPGIIDHREWTPANGRNNALRINGLGAPRAFSTPVLRKLNVPNVSYGEDYAVGLAISREYQIGRIYDPVYLCRRWEGNSDADLDVTKQNTYNLYKDRLRTFEIAARQRMNAAGKPAAKKKLPHKSPSSRRRGRR